MGSTANDQFRINAIIFCIIIVVVLNVAHGVGLMIKSDIETRQQISEIQTSGLAEDTKQQLLDNLKNMSKMDAVSMIAGFGTVMLGLDLPPVFAIFYTLLNAILIGYALYAIACIVRSYIPIVSG